MIVTELLSCSKVYCIIPPLYSTTVSVYPAQSQQCWRILFVSDVICVYWFVMYKSASLYTGKQQSRYYYKHLHLYVLESAQTVEERPWDPMHNSVQGRIQDFAKGGAPVHAKQSIVNNY